jgi:hypothetical protein
VSWALKGVAGRLLGCSYNITSCPYINMIKFVHIGKKMAESKSTWLVETTNLLIMHFESYEVLCNMKHKSEEKD